jgi:hypothetical protein
MRNPMRGHQVDLPICDSHADLIDGLEHMGFVRNAFLLHLANAALVFAKEEDDRLAASLDCEVAPTDLVVCRELADWNGRSSWLSIRKNRDQWFLSAVLFDAS